MSKLPIISGLDCVKALEKIGFVVDRQRGSHIIMVREEPRTTISVPDHKELDRGTLRGIIRQAGLSVDEFIELL
ncbi:type II toxin-antitoxin system HicA family toxin [Dolichospermum sp. UHCC 0684]|uniref:Type II toxin-antitoxin system HicA family toxin n=1 Tax=Aphanizomenon flos-aquae FACHB-1249 TaxID=2692889 RepID=A0ABR8IR22_APHFL|nr:MULTISPECIES: type II toxin-antitoxin system HicA family toxin [Aphanizomenonaceae]MBD2391006.1 type II toxin-antitoxin system HicA family toxin [Aphanizomenon flos-aquae FACHB-1171]MBD2557286.1 type II toxin-antitoxin system HicA family toxin [Aphanizomenon flos-aquae FACHB-1290]MBD2631874.1 type II toxin-antitoxin system HicA family toxin [Aphanizomenon sp. FACHB-1399]MBD2657664.1 type II toxin-antitoxin system HicA family toxin [Aphanizomenon flos-aquae FACHB-1265]MBD2673027.1 type II to